MAIYEFYCECGYKTEELQPIGSDIPKCPKCGEGMIKRPSFPALVKVKGEGGYPSRRKEWKGSCPYTTQSTKEIRDEYL